MAVIFTGPSRLLIGNAAHFGRGSCMNAGTLAPDVKYHNIFCFHLGCDFSSIALGCNRQEPAIARNKMTSRSEAGRREIAAPESPLSADARVRGRHTNLADLAYDRLEELLVTCTLPPGHFLSIQDLQQRTSLGRTPIHQAVSRLAADTLIVIRPRHGLQIAPVDLTRERTLLQLRQDMERFVVRLATERAGASHCNQLLHIGAILRNKGDRMTIGAFNRLDRRIDQLLLAAAGEPFLEHTMQPLHTIFRRIGWIYHSWVRPDEGLRRTLDCHLAIVDAVAAGRVRQAMAASDELICFSDSMFDVLSGGIDPALFDCNLADCGALDPKLETIAANGASI
jgi:DNA-binding GntR family transcriptional regulator